ncbi:MAG: tetratricopeptide repeat protein, partial [Pyrinomonadaceae bacterium]
NEMKRCPICRRDYYDETLLYCLDDGAALVDGPGKDSPAHSARPGAAFDDEPRTALLGSSSAPSEAPTRQQVNPGSPGVPDPSHPVSKDHDRSRRKAAIALVAGLVALAAIGAAAYSFYSRDESTQIQSIAVMPFLNESGNPDVEYLSDGMADSLINSLSQLPKLKVKARSYVFRYKGKDVLPQTVGSELNVQAILNGRIVQRGENLTLYLSLVDALSGDQIWGENYDRKMGDLVSLQTEIARDVSRKLGARLSGADERMLTTPYTANPEAYQNYLRGRYHTMYVTRPELLKAIPYFQKAIEIDPKYALAYVGLADAYRGLPLAGEMSPQEYFPKAKTAALRAIEIDDKLAEAHAVLGWIIYWWDWDFAEAEKHCRRAVELDPNSSDGQMAYAHVLSSLGRHDEAITRARTAREIEPLNVRTNTLEAQFLIHAGKPDEALDRLRQVLDLDPNYWFAYQFLASAYIDKGLYAEAIEAGKKGMEVYPTNTRNASFVACAKAKLGHASEARSMLAKMLEPAEGKYVPPFNIALVHNCLDDKDQTFTWLQKGIEQRDPRMTFLKSEPKWNNLRDDPRFQELLKRVGF